MKQYGVQINLFGEVPRQTFMVAVNDQGAALWLGHRSWHWIRPTTEPIRTVREQLNPKPRRIGWFYHIDHRKVAV